LLKVMNKYIVSDKRVCERERDLDVALVGVVVELAGEGPELRSHLHTTLSV